jgi:hypothetical protein
MASSEQDAVSSLLVVPEQAYLGGLNPFRETEDCLTHVAELHHPHHGPGRYFVKHYLEGSSPTKGLVNEVCGYLLAGAAGLPLPDRALLLELPAQRIAEMHPDYAGRIRGERIVVWTTSDTGGEPLPKDREDAGVLLRPWKQLGDLIAFDSWVLIPDRSAANLARRRNRQIVVIDHGHLAGSVRWVADMLPVADDYRHPFLDLWRPGQAPDALNQRIIVAAEQHTECLAAVEVELSRLMAPLLADDEDRIALLRFLKERAHSSPARMKRVLQMLA